ncbi:MAG: hypothetical protein E2O89_04935 [Alphaproteobacteria bacterium]|nr:MAG: hypothetical protein E2O89_04935 [Alphaproteobacteria bacterium]
MLPRSVRISRHRHLIPSLSCRQILNHSRNGLERIQGKHAPAKAGVGPVFRPNTRQNKDLEHVSDSIFCQRALVCLSCYALSYVRVELCVNIPAKRQTDYVQPGVGHYGVFNDSRYRTEIAPRIRDFIRSHLKWA